MKAAVLYEKHQPLVVEELSLEGPRQGEALVKLAASGFCRSDLDVMDGSREQPLPIVLGHEGAGTVVEVGPGVTYAKPGDHVVLSVKISCSHCSYCVRGQHHLCGLTYEKDPRRGGLMDGTTRMRNKQGRDVHHFIGVSSFGEYTVVPEDSLVIVREDAPLDVVALIGCGVSTGVGAAMHTAKVQPGSTVVVFGTGGVGLNVVQGAALAGAMTIIGVDINDPKLERARQFGATHVVNAASEDMQDAVREITRGEKADYAFEVIGSPETINQAIHTTRRGGVTVFIGSTADGAQLTVDPRFLNPDRVLMGCTYGSCNPRTDMPRFVDLYMEGKLKLDELITQRFSLEQINAAFDAMISGEGARNIISYA